MAKRLEVRTLEAPHSADTLVLDWFAGCANSPDIDANQAVARDGTCDATPHLPVDIGVSPMFTARYDKPRPPYTIDVPSQKVVSMRPVQCAQGCDLDQVSYTFMLEDSRWGQTPGWVEFGEAPYLRVASLRLE